MKESVKKNLSCDKNYFFVWNNIKKIFGYSEDKEMTKFLKGKGITAQDLYNWKKRKNISHEGLIELEQKIGISISILEGTENASYDSELNKSGGGGELKEANAAIERIFRNYEAKVLVQQFLINLENLLNSQKRRTSGEVPFQDSGTEGET